MFTFNRYSFDHLLDRVSLVVPMLDQSQLPLLFLVHIFLHYVIFRCVSDRFLSELLQSINELSDDTRIRCSEEDHMLYYGI